MEKWYLEEMIRKGILRENMRRATPEQQRAFLKVYMRYGGRGQHKHAMESPRCSTFQPGPLGACKVCGIARNKHAIESTNTSGYPGAAGASSS